MYNPFAKNFLVTQISLYSMQFLLSKFYCNVLIQYSYFSNCSIPLFKKKKLNTYTRYIYECNSMGSTFGSSFSELTRIMVYFSIQAFFYMYNYFTNSAFTLLKRGIFFILFCIINMKLNL